MAKHSLFRKFTTVLRLAAVGGIAVSGVGRSQNPPPASPAPGVRSAATIGKATFDHQLHFKTLQIECKACHHETNAATLRMPHQGYFKDFWIDCSICHKGAGAAVTKPQACSACHHGSPASIADETLSSKVVIHKKCWECHASGRGVEASNGCATCHRKTPQQNAVPQAPGASPKKGGRG